MLPIKPILPIRLKFGDCLQTEYGCCPDNITAKVDQAGSNCAEPGPTGSTGPTGSIDSTPVYTYTSTCPIKPILPKGTLSPNSGNISSAMMKSINIKRSPSNCGIAGPPGADGVPGITGPTGPNGPNVVGPIGPIGPIGPTGPTGLNGINGVVGKIGPTGKNAILPQINIINGTFINNKNFNSNNSNWQNLASINIPGGGNWWYISTKYQLDFYSENNVDNLVGLYIRIISGLSTTSADANSDECANIGISSVSLGFDTNETASFPMLFLNCTGLYQNVTNQPITLYLNIKFNEYDIVTNTTPTCYFKFESDDNNNLKAIIFGC